MFNARAAVVPSPSVQKKTPTPLGTHSGVVSLKSIDDADRLVVSKSSEAGPPLVVPSQPTLIAQKTACDGHVHLMSDAGRALLRSASHAEDFVRLAPFIGFQTNPTFCGIASLAGVFNGLTTGAKSRMRPVSRERSIRPPQSFEGQDATYWYGMFLQSDFLNATTDEVRTAKMIFPGMSGAKPFDPGLNLQDCAAIARLRGAEVEAVHAEDSGEGLRAFRQALKDTLANPERSMIVNFLGRGVGTLTGGHFSPVGAYNDQEDMVLVMDVAGHKQSQHHGHPYFWVPTAVLYQAMCEPDGDLPRGYMVVEIPEQSAPAPLPVAPVAPRPALVSPVANPMPPLIDVQSILSRGPTLIEQPQPCEKHSHVLTPEGITLLMGASHGDDFLRLAPFVGFQVNPTFCGIASLAGVMNGLTTGSKSLLRPVNVARSICPPEAFEGQASAYFYGMFVQDDFCDADTDAVKPKRAIFAGLTPDLDTPFDPGLNLADCAAIARTKGFEVTPFHVDALGDGNLGKERFRQVLRDSLSRDDVFVIANFLGKSVGTLTGGHFSPIGAYDEGTDQVLVMDVAGHKQSAEHGHPYFWVSVDDLYAAMEALDGERSRGFMCVSRPPD